MKLDDNADPASSWPDLYHGQRYLAVFLQHRGDLLAVGFGLR